MKLLQIIGTLNPSYGGPVESLTQSISAIQALGHNSEIVTLDEPGAAWLRDFPGVVHALGPSIGKYRFSFHLVPWINKNAQKYDVVIVRGIWQYQSFATWLSSRRQKFPYFVFIHGALNPWFRWTYPLKHIKKWLYWPWAEYRVLRDATGVLFTCEEERLLAAQSFGLYKANEIVVNYGTGKPVDDPDAQRKLFFDAYPALRGKRFILFLGRIHPVKGIDNLIDAFSWIAVQFPDVLLVIAGPDQVNMKQNLKMHAKKMGIENRIIWIGMLIGDLKWGAYNAADVFILPSHSESFGIVVAEALACSLPVLITDKVNIWREIVEDDAGMVDTDTNEGIIRLINKWLTLPECQQSEMRKNARHCFYSRFEMKIVTENFITIIQNTVGKATGQILSESDN